MIRSSLNLMIFLISVGHVSLSNADVAGDLVCKGCVDNIDLRVNAVTAANIKNNSLTGTDIKNSSLTGLDIKDSTLTGADIKNNSLNGSDIRNSSLTGADIRNSSLTGTDIKNSSLTGLDIKDSTLTGADIKNSSLGGADIKDNSLTGADIRNSSLTGADIAKGTVDDNNLSQELRDKINGLTTTIERLEKPISDSSKDRFKYRYERKDRLVGEVFTVDDVEYEMAEFDVVSLLDHSVFSVKLPIKISYFHLETYPVYGLEIDVSGENNSSAYRIQNNTIDGYPANITYHTRMEYASEAVNRRSDFKSDFDADGQLKSARIYNTYLTVYKDSTEVYCREPSIDFDSLPENLSYASLYFDSSNMDVYYNDGTARKSSVPISSAFSGLVSDCLNSDPYLKQQYSIETTISVSASIYLDDDTYFSFYISHPMSAPNAEVYDYDRYFGGVIDVANEVPNADDRHSERQRIWQLFNNIVITKK